MDPREEGQALLIFGTSRRGHLSAVSTSLFVALLGKAAKTRAEESGAFCAKICLLPA